MAPGVLFLSESPTIVDDVGAIEEDGISAAAGGVVSAVGSDVGMGCAAFECPDVSTGPKGIAVEASKGISLSAGPRPSQQEAKKSRSPFAHL